MTDFDYKKYSLENLENWIYDAMSSGEATPQEIYDVIVNVVKDNYYRYKHQTSQAYELLTLLNKNPFENTDSKGNQVPVNDCMPPWGHSDLEYLVNDSINKSLQIQKSYNDFWEEHYYPEENKSNNFSDYYPHPNQVVYTEEELNAMCDKAASDEEKDKCREYNLREAEYYDKRAQLDAKEDKVTRWVLPVQVDGLTGECYVQFPDDLLELAGLKEGDMVNWIDRGDSSFELRKVTKPLGMDEC